MDIDYLDAQGRERMETSAEMACGHFDEVAAVIRNDKVHILSADGGSKKTKANHAKGPFFDCFIGSVRAGNDEDVEGLLASSGKWRVKPVFADISCWNGEYFSANNEWCEPRCVYRANGDLMIEDCVVGALVSENLVGAYGIGDKKGRTGFRSLDGRWQIKPRFDSATQFVDGKAFVVEGLGAKRKSGIIDKRGEWLRTFPKDVVSFVEEISEGIVGVYRGKTCGLMNQDGELLCEGSWNLMDQKVVGGAIPVVDFRTKKFGLLGINGGWLLKPKYHDLVDQVGPFVVFRRKSSIGSDITLVNTKGDILWEGPPAKA